MWIYSLTVIVSLTEDMNHYLDKQRPKLVSCYPVQDRWKEARRTNSFIHVFTWHRTYVGSPDLSLLVRRYSSVFSTDWSGILSRPEKPSLSARPKSVIQQRGKVFLLEISWPPLQFADPLGRGKWHWHFLLLWLFDTYFGENKGR